MRTSLWIGMLLAVGGCGSTNRQVDAGGDAGRDAVADDSGIDAGPHARFVVVSRTVVDTSTGLVWERSPAAKVYNAPAATAHCDELDLDGATDWRVPSFAELFSIVDYAQTSPMIDRRAFPSTAAWFYGTSTHPGDETAVWNISFDFGHADATSETELLRIRCVRGAPLAPPSFVVDTGVVSDATTGLQWERAVDPTYRTQAEAVSYCAALELGGKSDWRIPSLAENVSILDHGRSFGPSESRLDPDAFPESPLWRYWGSTPRADAPEAFWIVSLPDGGVFSWLGTELGYVRCVRGEE